MAKRILAVALMLIFVLATQAQAGTKRIVAFGDSFSDDGISDGYGFSRKSNGDVWVEHLARMLHAELEDRAWCGARSGSGNAAGFDDWSGLAWQVDNFQPKWEQDDTLYTVLIGINDIYDGDDRAGEVVGNILSAMNKLAGKGAVNILVSNVPDITLAPAYIKDYAAKKEAVQKVTRDINARLETALFGKGGFAGNHPSVHVYFVDAYGVFNELVAGKHFKNMEEPWYGTYKYPHPDGHMWWDSWHPMTEAHRTLARAAVQAVEAGPRK
ncbi:SGNH/GDSL hydrolase family protein [Salidesulfovibrio onnuriiensis]|uniref:SGNH/GDSL hydrolase family protein n=1 Tax=Salidesulfovibrio onnuriiensis TaxID=2583823 RepID=UPI0016508644|nr:SGNH/GDSL hydrolase family protein [Salidesulfovibrio onnuriiensis]